MDVKVKSTNRKKFAIGEDNPLERKEDRPIQTRDLAVEKEEDSPVRKEKDVRKEEDRVERNEKDEHKEGDSSVRKEKGLRKKYPSVQYEVCNKENQPVQQNYTLKEKDGPVRKREDRRVQKEKDVRRASDHSVQKGKDVSKEEYHPSVRKVCEEENRPVKKYNALNEKYRPDSKEGDRQEDHLVRRKKGVPKEEACPLGKENNDQKEQDHPPKKDIDAGSEENRLVRNKEDSLVEGEERNSVREDKDHSHETENPPLQAAVRWELDDFDIMDYIYEDSFKLHDMIDSDIRSLRELGDWSINDLNYTSGGSHLESMGLNGIHMDAFDSIDSDEGRAGWMNGLQLLNGSADFDSINGLLVNPRTALPISMSDTLNSSSLSVSENSNLASDGKAITSGSVTVTVPIQVITTNPLSTEMTDVNLTVAVPTPSPSPHNSSALFSPQDSNVNQDSSDSLKPKSKNKRSNQNNSENAYPKPAYSYSCLIAMALKNSRTGSLPVNEIYDFMTENFPYFKTAPNGWKNSVRHNLSLNKCFEKIEKPAGNSTQRKGYLWAMNPAKVEKMEEELQKWGSKDPIAIRKSMANPERLELIEKGELRSADSDTEIESMNVSQEDEEEESYSKDEKENEVKVQVSGIANETMNDFSFRDTSVNIEQCLPELDIQKGLWDSLIEDRLPFLTDSPMSPLSPKNSETMDDDSSQESTPSTHRSYVHANFIYKSRATTSESTTRLSLSSNPDAAADKGSTL